MDPYLAEIRLFAGNFAPLSWAYCDGQILSIAENTALFSLIGTIYGGNGQTTFALPDFRGRVPVSPGTGPGLSTRYQGEMSGSETVTLNVQQMPMHSHQAVAGGGLQTGTGKGETGNPQGNYIDDSTIATDLFKPNGGGAPMKGAEGITVTNQSAGGSQAHNNMQPFMAINYIICTEGIYPSRN